MNDFAAAKDAFKEYHHAVEEFKQTNDQKIAQLKSEKAADPLANEKLARIGASIDELQEKLNLLTKKIQRPQLTSNLEAKQFGTNNYGFNSNFKKNDLNYQEYCHAFSNYLRWASDKHGEGLAEEHRKSLNFGASTDGGYWFPDTMTNAIDDAIVQMSPLRKHCSSVRISGEHFSYPEKGALAAYWRNVHFANVSQVPFDPKETKIEVCEHYTAPKVSQAALGDPHFNIESWLVKSIAESFVTSETDALLSGNGNNLPLGILSAPELTSSSGRAVHKQVQTITKSITDDNEETIKTLYELIYALKSKYRQNSMWIMNRRTALKMRQLKDNNDNYLWAASSSPQNTDYFLGYQVLETDQASDLNADNTAIAFANLRRAYLIVDHSMSMIRDPYSSKPWVVFYVTRKVGGGVVNAEALKFLKTPVLTP